MRLESADIFVVKRSLAYFIRQAIAFTFDDLKQPWGIEILESLTNAKVNLIVATVIDTVINPDRS